MSHDMEISQLEDRHKKLEAEIQSEFTRPVPDDLRINELKKEKLRIKDELLRLGSVH